MKFIQILLLALFCLTLAGFFGAQAIPAPVDDRSPESNGRPQRVKRQFRDMDREAVLRKKRQFAGVNEQHGNHPGKIEF